MDISFTSDEEDDDNASVKAKINTSDLYYDTNKSGKGEKRLPPLRTLEIPARRPTASHSVSDTSHVRKTSKH